MEIEKVAQVDSRYARRFGYCGSQFEADHGLLYALLPHEEEVHVVEVRAQIEEAHVIEITKADEGIWAMLKGDALLEEGGKP